MAARLPLFLLFLQLLLQLAQGQQNGQGQSRLINVRYCDPKGVSGGCYDLAREIGSDGSLRQGRLSFSMPDDGRSFAGYITCVAANSEAECAQLLLDGKADMARMSAEQLYGLSKVREFADALVPVAAGKTQESCSTIGTECHKFAREYSVAVVSKTAGIRQLGDLRDKRPCFDEVGDTSGWIIPVYKLIANWTNKPPFIVTRAERQRASQGFQFASSRLSFSPRHSHRRLRRFKRQTWTNVSRPYWEDDGRQSGSQMKLEPGPVVRPTQPGRTTESCPLDLSIPNDIFPQSCAPGPWATDPGLSSFGERLCGACAGRGAECSASNPSNGALQCLTSGRGDVAFVSSRKLEKFFANGANDPASYGFVCRQGLRETDEFRYCHWGMVPEDSYVVRRTASPIPPLVLGQFIHILYSHVKGRSYKYPKGLPFLADSAVVASVERLDKEYKQQQPPTAQAFLEKEGGEAFDQAMAQAFPNCGDKDVMRLCVASTQERWKCKKMAAAFAAAGLPRSLSCIVGYGVDSCIRMINASQADLAWIPSHKAEQYSQRGTVKPIMDEVEDSEAFAVAVALEGGRVNALSDLSSGQINVCSSGTDSFAGWEAPNAAFKKLQLIPKKQCQLTEAWAKMFRTSCVPGATNASVTWGRNVSTPISPTEVRGLCAGCGGGIGACLTPSQALDSAHQNYDTYYGDIGALRCLARRKADVAFVKSSAIKTVLSLRTDHDFQSLSRSSLRLLCLDGSYKRSVDEGSIKACNLGPQPDKWLVARGDASLEQLRRWQDLWMAAFHRSRSSFDWTKTRLSLQPGKTEHLLDLIFSNTTGAFRRLPLNSSQEFLHNAAFENWQSPFQQCNSAVAIASPLSSLLLCILFAVTSFLLR